MERKRYTFFTRRRISFVHPLDEWPNRKDSFSRKLWGIIFYGPDFSTDQVDENSEQMGKEDDTLALIEMVKELQTQNAIFQKKVMASLEENGKPSKSVDASQGKMCILFYLSFILMNILFVTISMYLAKC